MYMKSQIEKALYKWRPERRQELLLGTDKPLIAYYMALGYLDGQCTYFLVVKPGRKYVLISKYALKSQVHLKTRVYGNYIIYLKITAS